MAVDALVSPTLKHLREQWWDDEFTAFLVETLRPRPGNRILDVGCGSGVAAVRIGRLQISQIELYGVDLRSGEITAAAAEAAAHNLRAEFVVGDARRLPFRDGVFDSTYCVAVLQHLAEVDQVLGEFARVTVSGGRIVAVEPDNAARYAYSSSASGAAAFDAATRLFAELAAARGEAPDGAIGPKIPVLFARHGIESLEVRLFPVSHVQIGGPDEGVWAARRARAVALAGEAGRAGLETLGSDYLRLLEAYEEDARRAGATFIEIQHTMLFGIVGQKSE